jgi:hypothetical protein
MWFGRLLAVFIGIIVFIVILVALLGHGKKTPTAHQTPLPEYAGTNATVSFTTDGIVNNDSLHRSIRVTVSNSSITLDVLQGYNPQVIQSNTFQNNQEAYSVFLKAINNAGFMLKSKSTKVSPDPAGQCPLGFRYILNLNQDDQDISNTWTSSCGAKTGTSLASLSLVQTLFQYQVPNYQSLVSNINLSATTTQ